MEARVDTDERHRMIAEAAYFRAERRGFSGDPVVDWVEAEAEVDAALGDADRGGETTSSARAESAVRSESAVRAARAGLDHGELLARIETRIAEAGRKVEALRKKASAIEGGTQTELRAQVEKLGELRDALETRSREIRDQGARSSRGLLEQAESLWSELTEFLTRKTKAPKARGSSARRN